MKTLSFSASIRAPKESVWKTLWTDASLREWAGLIDPGTYMVGTLVEGEEVQFLSAENGYGVTSLVQKVIPGELVVLLHEADTQKSGTELREKQWTGSEERYALSEKDGVTTLTISFGVPPELESYFLQQFPKAMDRIKILSEAGT